MKSPRHLQGSQGDRRLVAVDIVPLDDGGHLTARSFSAGSTAYRRGGNGRGRGEGGEVQLVEVRLTVAPWADGAMNLSVSLRTWRKVLCIEVFVSKQEKENSSWILIYIRELLVLTVNSRRIFSKLRKSVNSGSFSGERRVSYWPAFSELLVEATG